MFDKEQDPQLNSERDFERELESEVRPASATIDPHPTPDPPRPLPPTDHTERISRFDRLVVAENQRRLELLDAVAAADDESFWHDAGAPSMAHWLRYRYKVSRSHARHLTTTAGALQSLPAVRRLFGSGELSWDQLRAIVTVADKVDHPDPDAYLAALAPGKTPEEIRALVAPPTPVDADPSTVEGIADRWLRYRFSETEPVMEMHVTMPDVEGATLVTALMRRSDQRDVDPTTGEFLPHETAMCDALVEIASQTLADDSDHDRATILVATTVDRLLGTSDDAARLVDGPLISNQTLERLACDARLQLAIEEPGKGTVGVGRTTRSIPPWLSRIIRARDGGCRFPECDRVRWVQIHHLVHWSNGGPTDADNLVTLCGFHHRLIHHSKWSISGDPEGDITWIAPWGAPYHQLRVTMAGVEWARKLRAIPHTVHPPERKP